MFVVKDAYAHFTLVDANILCAADFINEDPDH